MGERTEDQEGDDEERGGCEEEMLEEVWSKELNHPC